MFPNSIWLPCFRCVFPWGKTHGKNRFRGPRVPGIRVRGQHTKTTGRHRAFAAMDGGKKKWEAASRENRWHGATDPPGDSANKNDGWTNKNGGLTKDHREFNERNNCDLIWFNDI